MDSLALFAEWFPQYTLGDLEILRFKCGGGCCDLQYHVRPILYQERLVTMGTEGQLTLRWHDYNDQVRTLHHMTTPLPDAHALKRLARDRYYVTLRLERNGYPVLKTEAELRDAFLTMEPETT